MKRATFTLAAGLILTGAASPQNLPPDVLLLSRVRRHIKEELQHLPNVTCLETVRREHQPAKGKMQPLDTVRLEVLTNGQKELFASPGDRSFSELPPISFVGSGALGDGYFGLYLRTILVTGNASYAYKGEEDIGGRHLARWEYRLPLMWSGQTIQLPHGAGKVSLNGSFWADPQTYDVARLAVNAADFPPSLPLTEARWSVDYSRTSLGGLAVLMPQSAEFRMTTFSGEISFNELEFTQCRVFGAQSTINFDGPDSAEVPSRFGVSAIDDTLRSLPPGLQIPVRLRSSIPGDAAVGALIDGVIDANVAAKGAIAIAAGSPVRGRIRRLERYSDPFPHFVVALEFTEVESQGIRYRFDADLARIDPAPGVEQTLSHRGRTETVDKGFFQEFRVSRETLFFSNLPGVATFFFKGATLNVPEGLRTVWTTRPTAP
ncbi:MAG: hypothetical protein ABSG41_17130 [Bryobacteraceae bacterium]|jgi:hypothetical protein